MKTNRVQQLVADFWAGVGYEEPFPRQLECSIMSSKPVFIVKVHRQRLDSAYIQRQLQQRGIQFNTHWTDRKLDGCLIAFKGEAAIFVDGTLSPEECRVVIGHEFGHFLADYEHPRQMARRHLGDSILEVLDGRRRPTNQERLAAVLTNVPIGIFVHYMDRCNGMTQSATTRRVENTAELVAAELLAPLNAVISETTRGGAALTRHTLASTLRERFGVPRDFAERYAGRIAQRLSRGRSFSEIMGLPRQCRR